MLLLLIRSGSLVLGWRMLLLGAGCRYYYYCLLVVVDTIGCL